MFLRVIFLLVNIFWVLMVFRGFFMLLIIVGGNINGFFVVNIGDDWGNLRVLEGFVGMEDVFSELK